MKAIALISPQLTHLLYGTKLSQILPCLLIYLFIYLFITAMFMTMAIILSQLAHLLDKAKLLLLLY
jgi:hypothetical protein